MALGDRDIIGDVTKTLSSLLTESASQIAVTQDSPATLQKLTGDEAGKINLYLYQVIENPFAKNQEWTTLPDGRLRYPPLALNLYYLLTPFASNQVAAHHVLGHAMQVLHENSVVSEDRLKGDLGLTTDQLTLNLCPMKLEELTRIWNALQTPYRLSVIYQVRVVLVEAKNKEREPCRVMVSERVYQQL